MFEYLEIGGLLTGDVYRGMTFQPTRDPEVLAYNLCGSQSSRYLWSKTHGEMTQVSKEQFEMLWNLYSVTGKEAT